MDKRNILFLICIFKSHWQSFFHGQSTNVQTFYGLQYSPKETDFFKPICSSKEVSLSTVPAWLWMKLKQIQRKRMEDSWSDISINAKPDGPLLFSGPHSLSSDYCTLLPKTFLLLPMTSGIQSNLFQKPTEHYTIWPFPTFPTSFL